MYPNLRQKGFTIVELLIVIVVIGVLAAITIVAYNGVQKRARDSHRMSDIAAIDNAIKLYIADKGHAPDFGGACRFEAGPNVSSCFANDQTHATASNGYGWSALQTELSPYITKLPVDPCGVKCQESEVSQGQTTYHWPWYNYVYHAPADLPAVFGGKASTAQDYFLGAETLEAAGGNFSFGFGSF